MNLYLIDDLFQCKLSDMLSSDVIAPRQANYRAALPHMKSAKICPSRGGGGGGGNPKVPTA